MNGQLNTEKLRELMESRSINQKEMAFYVGVSAVAMSYFVRGVKQPSLFVVKRMADCLDVTVDEIIVDNKEE